MTPPDSTEAEIDALQTLCERLAGFDDRVSLEWLDGYLVALLAGPRAVPTSEWLERMLGDAWTRTFGDPKDTEQALATLLARWNVVARQLDPESLLDEPDVMRLSPLIVSFSDEERAAALTEVGWKEGEPDPLPNLGELWAHGFLDALDDFADDWIVPDPQDEESAPFHFGIAAVVALVDRDPESVANYFKEFHEGEVLTRDELIEDALYAVQDLRLWWVDHAPRHPPRQVEPQPGRNDPCPCGSGKKFKKCHGA